MPFVKVPAVYGENGTENAVSDFLEIFYRTYGTGETKIVFIMGFGAGHGGWHPQVIDLAGSLTPNETDDDLYGGDELARHRDDASFEFADENGDPVATDERYTCLVFDNRGIGNSSCPQDKTLYTTTNMAKDALVLMDHLNWEKAHIVGHSMGGMIASKLAATAPERVLSLAILSSSCGGYYAFPKITRKFLRVAYRLVTAKTPEKRAKADLEAHYSKAHLNEKVDGIPRRELLFKKYLGALSISSRSSSDASGSSQGGRSDSTGSSGSNGESGGAQNQFGVDGHLYACATHGITTDDLRALRSGKFLISIIHGRHDIVAHISKGERLYRRLKNFARMVTLPGGHMINAEKPSQVNAAIKELISATKSGVHHLEWVKGSVLWKKFKEEGDQIRKNAASGLSAIGQAASQVSRVPRWTAECALELLTFVLFWAFLFFDYLNRVMYTPRKGQAMKIHRSESARKIIVQVET